jgi:mono/diheme cytochrome c family protein
MNRQLINPIGGLAMKHIFIDLATIGFASILVACGGELSQTPVEIGDPERGREIFTDASFTKCEGCHSLDGSEFRGGPSLLGISERAAERVPELSAVEYLRQSILEPSAHIVEGYKSDMKVYELVERAEGDYKAPGTLTEEELNDLVAFLLTQ